MTEHIVSWAFRSGIRKGVLGASGPWLVIAVAAGAVKLLNRPTPRKSMTLGIKPGERYTILCGNDASLRAAR